MLALALSLAAAAPAYAPPPPDAPLELPPVPSPPAAPPSATVPDAGRRRLFEVGLQGGAALDVYSGRCKVSGFGSGLASGCLTALQGGGLGPYLRGGLQLDDRWSFEIEAALGTAIASSYGRGALTAGVTFGDWFALSLGPVVSGVFAQLNQSAAAVGATVRADFHPWWRRTIAGRDGFTLGLAVDAAATVAGTGFVSTGLAVSGTLAAGWAWY